MKKIYNPKIILYLLPDILGFLFGIFFFIADPAQNYVVGIVFLALSFLLLFIIVQFVPRSYTVYEEGIRIFYAIGKCNFIPWETVQNIRLHYDCDFDIFFFWKNYVICHNASKSYTRPIDMVTKTKKTKSEIEKYWWGSIL